MSESADKLQISPSERAALYRIISLRRDVRAFSSEPVPDEVLVRLLRAAHDGPSVGYSQPWRFVILRSQEARARIAASFEAANAIARLKFHDERRAAYDKLKLQGLQEAPVVIVVGCERTSIETLGRDSMPETDVYSTVCAIQNLWLAARAENLGVGWVSIIDPNEVHAMAGFSEAIQLVAVLCIGKAARPGTLPELERVGWRSRAPLANAIALDTWDGVRDPLLDSELEREELAFRSRFADG